MMLQVDAGNENRSVAGSFRRRVGVILIMAGGALLAGCDGIGKSAPSPGTILWTVERSGEGVVFGPEGRIGRDNDHGELYALDRKGRQEWVYRGMEQGGAGLPTLAPDGTVYMGSLDHRLYAVKNGEARWSFEATDWVLGGPAVGVDGTVYFGDADGSFFALSPQGEERWTFEPHGVWIGARPSVGTDGTVYVGDGDRQRGELGGHLYALAPTGEVRWVYKVSDWVKYGPAVGADGTAYVAAGEHLHAVRHGRRAWIFRAEGSVDVQPVLGPDGTLYFGTRAGRFHALSLDGERKWTLELAEVDGFHRGSREEFDPPTRWGQVLTAAAAGDNGHIYVGTRHGLLVALSEAGDVRWSRKMPGDFMGPGDIRLGPGGTLYVANDEGLHAIATDADGPADSPWPQYGGDLAGSGRQP